MWSLIRLAVQWVGKESFPAQETTIKIQEKTCEQEIWPFEKTILEVHGKVRISINFTQNAVTKVH